MNRKRPRICRAALSRLKVFSAANCVEQRPRLTRQANADALQDDADDDAPQTGSAQEPSSRPSLAQVSRRRESALR